MFSPFVDPLGPDLHHEAFTRRVPASIVGVQGVEEVVASAEESTYSLWVAKPREVEIVLFGVTDRGFLRVEEDGGRDIGVAV